MTAAMGAMGPQDQPMEEAGRQGDTDLGHLTPGEIVLPVELVTARGAMEKLSAMFEEAGMDIEEFTVGHEKNKTNPETGYPEFFSLSKMFTGKSRSQRRRDAESAVEAKTRRQNEAHYARVMAALQEQREASTKKTKADKAKLRAESLQSQLQFKNKLSQIKGASLFKGSKADEMSADKSSMSNNLPMQKRKFARRRDIARKISSFNARRPT